MTKCIFGGLVILVLSASAFAESVRLPVVQDNSIVMVDGEWSVNAGSSGRIRIKGNQHIVAMSFDLSSIRGKKVKRAELVCHVAVETISGVTISTIATPWDEMTSTGLTAGINGVDGWGYPGARFPAVAGGNAFTLVHQTTSEPQDGTYHWEVPADMVHAMATNAAFGLAIHEHDADYGRNPTIFSREQSSKQPYLIVEIDDRPDAAPLPPTELKLIPVDSHSARLTLKSPAEGFAYEVSIDGQPLGRHNIPLVSPASMQTIHLRDLSESVTRPGTHQVQVITLNRTGRRSKPASVQGELFKIEALHFPQVNQQPARRPTIADVSIIPVTDKYDRSGQPVGALPEDYRTHNSVFDGQRIRLTAAAGEVLGFQVLLRGTKDVAVRCQLERLNWRVDLFQAVYVPAKGRQVPDPLLPLPETIRLERKTDEAVFVDLYVPFDAAPGDYSGKLTVSDGREVPIALTVLPVQLPRKASFLCEMNGYGLPDHVDEFYALQQEAYDHRVHANILHYSHHTAAPGARKTNLDMRLRSGRRMDNKRYDAVEPGAKQAFWDDFTEAFGPYLDGSYFQDGHRGPIPAPGFYLTFHESWPLNCRAYFNGNPDAYRAFADKPVYAETYVNVLTDFARLAKDQGWTDTGFQVYFNNKGSLHEQTKAPWILDEPAAYWDYRALQYYGELTDRGRQETDDMHIDYRIDISRPEYCRGQLSGRSDLWVVSSSAFQNYRRLVTDRMEQDGLKVWVYGTSNPVHESNRQLQAWALDAWRHGATGLVPWQTVDKSGQALRKADQLGLFIFDKDAQGNTVIRHSSRLKAYREAEQLIELLALVQQRQDWSSSQMRAFIDHYVTLSGSVRQQNDDDAGTAEYDRHALLQVDTLRQAAIELLQ
ncbi:MAG: DNRLRE domain-containing protein [Planctomycetaceae bacterium]